MIEEVRLLMETYRTWLKDKTSLREVNDWVEITAPYLDRHNDYIQIFAQKRGNDFILTDDGYTIEDLISSGCKLDSKKRSDLLKLTLAGFGVRQDGNALTITTSPDTFSLRKHNLIQAILAVNDMFYLAEPVVASVFYEDVQKWLTLHNVRYVPRVRFVGKTGFDHQFDFAIPRSVAQPERLLRVVSHPTKDQAQSIIMAWMDTKEVREPDSKLYALLNDSEHAVPDMVSDALVQYEVTPVAWSQRDNFRAALAA